jgi:hypothetical protein
MTKTTAVIQQQKKRKKKVRSVDEIFDWTLKELYKAAELFSKRKSDIILETAKRLEEDAGIEPSKICDTIAKRLEGFVDDSYVQKVLKDYPQYKNNHQSKRAKSGRNIPAGREENAEPKQSQKKQKQTETIQQYEESTDDAPTGEYQMKVEDYDINDVHLYDRKFLIELVRYLHNKME